MLADVLTLSELTLPTGQGGLSLVPPPRFDLTTFAQYVPQDPSQAQALTLAQGFIQEATSVKRPWWHRKPLQGKGLYLDGGFGVGKTHLLASAYNAFEADKAYLSFQELVYILGVLRKEKAQEVFAPYKLICIDEFELDDPGNTLIVKTFLASVFAGGAYVVTTSNTPPAAQGQGRFNANDFKREIQSIAERFEIVAVGGPDYRKREHISALLSVQELTERLCHEQKPRKVHAPWPDLIAFLKKYHPIRYKEVLKQIGTLYIADIEQLELQNDALRFVHFIDMLYDMRVGLRASGKVALPELFHSSYRDGAYAKKHYRCLSRLSELIEEV